jgi:tripeptidyl-peptidase-1
MKSVLLLLAFLTICLAKPGFTFYVALPQDPTGVGFLERYVLDFSSNVESSLYGHHLTTDEICSLTSGPEEHYNKVTTWFSNRKIICQRQCDALKCRGLIRHINEALGTDLKLHQDPSTSKFRFHSETPYIVPDELRESIVFIDGLSNNVHNSPYKRHTNVKSFKIADSGVISREVLMRMYNLPDTSVSDKVSLGAMEYLGGNGFSNDDLQVDQVYNGVAKNPVADNHIIGTNNDPDGESTLDVQVLYWAASGATLWYEDFSGVNNGWMFSWANNFLNRTDYPYVVSISWGWSEVNQCTVGKCNKETTKQYIDRTNVEFLKIVARGTTIVVASGDAGSPGRTNELCESQNGPYGWNHINAIFPGSSPWVLSVGATYVVAPTKPTDFQTKTPICTNVSGISCATGTTENMVTFTEVEWTSGSGVSRFTKTPKWQQSVVTKYLAKPISFPDQKYFDRNGRFYPDVSAFGHNCVIYGGDGSWTTEDGTSCASPIFAGVIAHLNGFQLSRGKPVLGFVNPLLYKMYNDDPSTFHDITVGNSSCTEAECCGSQFGFLATTGWDTVAGLGTPNVQNMMNYIKKYA